MAVYLVEAKFMPFQAQNKQRVEHQRYYVLDWWIRMGILRNWYRGELLCYQKDARCAQHSSILTNTDI